MGATISFAGDLLPLQRFRVVGESEAGKGQKIVWFCRWGFMWDQSKERLALSLKDQRAGLTTLAKTPIGDPAARS